MTKEEKVIVALKQCLDPEIGIDVYTLGLIYNIDLKGNEANIKMTFTSPMCPYGPMLVEEIKNKVKGVENIKKVNVEVTFNPPWQPSDELRSMLGV